MINKAILKNWDVFAWKINYLNSFSLSQKHKRILKENFWESCGLLINKWFQPGQNEQHHCHFKLALWGYLQRATSKQKHLSSLGYCKVVVNELWMRGQGLSSSSHWRWTLKSCAFLLLMNCLHYRFKFTKCPWAKMASCMSCTCSCWANAIEMNVNACSLQV